MVCDAATISVRNAYNGGSSIITTNNNNISFVMPGGLATPDKFIVSQVGNADAFDIIASGSATNAMLLNLNTGGTITNGINVNQNGATVTNGIMLGGTIANGINFSGTNYTSLIANNNFTVTGTGSAILAQNLQVNGGAIYTSQSNAQLFGTGTTTIGIGNAAGAATTINIGTYGSGGTSTTVNSATFALSSNTTSFAATAATGGLLALNINGGYVANTGSGASLDSAGDAQFNGLLQVDKTATISGLLAANAGVQVGGVAAANITIGGTSNTANVFNTIARTVSVAGAATTSANFANGTGAFAAINIGNGANASGTTHVNIANGAVTSGADAVIIGNTIGASSVGINAGSGNLTLNAGSGASGNITLGINGIGTIQNNVANATNSAFLVQQGANNYIGVTTNATLATNNCNVASTCINFGNTTTNPQYNFLGTGTASHSGNLTVNGGSINAFMSMGTFNLLNTGVGQLNIGGQANVSIGGAVPSTTTINNNFTVATGTTSTIGSNTINFTAASPVIDTTNGTAYLSIDTASNHTVQFGSSGGLITGSVGGLSGFNVDSTAINLNYIPGGSNAYVPINIAASSDLSLNSTSSGTINIGNTNINTINLEQGTTGTGCTLKSGNFSCTGNIYTTGAGTQQVGFFNRTSTGIISNTYPADVLTLSTSNTGATNGNAYSFTSSNLTSSSNAINNTVTINSGSAAQSYYGINETLTNTNAANSDTIYGQYINLSDSEPLADTDIGLKVNTANVTGAGNINYEAIFTGGGNVGINTTTPVAGLQVNSNSNTTNPAFIASSAATTTVAAAQILTAANSNNTALQVSSGGTTGVVMQVLDPSLATTCVAGTCTAGTLLQVVGAKNANSLTPTSLTVTNTNTTLGGHTLLQQPVGSGTVQDVYVYDTTKDSNGGIWTNNDAAQSSSWYNETLGTATRGTTQAFPQKAIIVGTNSSTGSVSIYNAADNSLWMSFNKSANLIDNMVGSSSAAVKSVYALDGKIFVGTATGLYVIDFTRDMSYRYNSVGNYIGDENILNRNNPEYWNQLQNGSTAVNLMANSTINYVRAANISGTDYFAAATNGGTGAKGAVFLYNYSAQTPVANFGQENNSPAGQVALTTTGNLYATFQIVAGASQNYVIKAYYNAVSDANPTTAASVIYGNSGATNNYGTSTSDGTSFSFTPGPAPSNNNFVPTSLLVQVGGSSIDGMSDTIYATNNSNLLEINTYKGHEGSGSVKYLNNNYITDQLYGNTVSYLPLAGFGTINQGSYIASDSAPVSPANTYAYQINGGSAMSYTSGVRGTGVSMDGAHNYICTANLPIVANACANNTNLNFSGSFSVGAWVKQKSATGSAQTIIAKSNYPLSTVGSEYSLYLNQFNQAAFEMYGGNRYTATAASSSASDQNWHYYVGVYISSAQEEYLYVDGSLVAQQAVPSVNTSPTIPYSIGADLGAPNSLPEAFLNGSIDEPFATQAVLTQAEIQQSYQVGNLALQNHTASRVTGIVGPNSYQQLSGGGNFGGTVASTSAVAMDDTGTKLYVGTYDTAGQTGGLSVIGTNSDSLIDLYSSINTTKVDDVNHSLNSTNINNIQAVSLSGTQDNGGVLAYGGTNNTTSQFWTQSANVSLQQFISNNYNPFGTTLNQENLNVNNMLSLNGAAITTSTNSLNMEIPSNGSFNILNAAGTVLSLTDSSTNPANDTLAIGQAGSRNGVIWLDSAGTNISAAEIFTDVYGNLTLEAVQPTASTFVGSGNGNISLIPSGTSNVQVELGGSATGSFQVWDNGITYANFSPNGLVGIGFGNTSPLATLDVRGDIGTLSVASISGVTSYAGLVVNNEGSGDLFAASSSGAINRFVIKQNGNVGIGTTMPSYGLDVQNTQAATSAARIWNTFNLGSAVCNIQGISCQTALILELGAAGDNHVPGTKQYFTQFDNGVGQIMGSIKGSGGPGVIYQTQGADYAEYYTVDPNILPQNYTQTDVNAIFPTGILVCQDSNGVIPCYTTSNPNIVGIISNAPSVEGGIEGPNTVLVGLIGQLPLQVSTINGPIHVGDPLTSSTIPGVAMKATTAGEIIGHAEQADTDSNTSDVATIQTSSNRTWYDPDVYLTSTGNINLYDNGSNPATGEEVYGVNNNGQNINRNGVFSNGVIGNLQAGYVNAQNIDLAGENLNSNILGLQSAASASALLNGTVNNIATQSSQLQTQVNTIQDEVAQLQSQVASQGALISNLQFDAALSGFNASSSGELDLNQLGINDATVSGSLTVLGQTLLNDVGVTGTFNDGVMTINGLDESGQASINTVGDLKLQDQGAGGIDILNGEITIDTSGNLVSQGSITAQTINTTKLNITGASTATESGQLSASAGVDTISNGTDNLTIQTSAVSANSLIYVTFGGDYYPATRYWISDKTPGQSFTIQLDQPVESDTQFSWWIVN